MLYSRSGLVIDWRDVDCVLLDMDGTLLDLHYDTYFWLHHVPQRYAEKHALTLEESRDRLMPHYERKLGTMEWYSIDYWSRELVLDIAALKAEVAHLIAVRPHVPAFLARLRTTGKRLILVTNAHRKSLDLKMRHTGLAPCFDGMVCAHDIGIPKEHPDFWGKLRREENYQPARTLLIDDSLPVLRSARGYGVAYLLTVCQPDSHQPEKVVAEFAAVASFADLMPPFAS